MNKIVVIDVGYIMFRSIMGFRTKLSPPLGWFYWRSIVAILKRCEIDYDTTVILAKDSPLGSWRREIVPAYKANRKEKREKQEDKEFWDACFKEIDQANKKVEESTAYHVINLPKLEADDIASVICRHYPDKPIILASSDSDWKQLLSYPNVKLMSVITKKFITEDDPIGVLKTKIDKGDTADNLIGHPQNELELEKRRKVVSLLELPDHVENVIKWHLSNLPAKSFYWSKIPYRSIKADLYSLYETVKEKK